MTLYTTHLFTKFRSLQVHQVCFWSSLWISSGGGSLVFSSFSWKIDSRLMYDWRTSYFNNHAKPIFVFKYKTLVLVLVPKKTVKSSGRRNFSFQKSIFKLLFRFDIHELDESSISLALPKAFFAVLTSISNAQFCLFSHTPKFFFLTVFAFLSCMYIHWPCILIMHILNAQFRLFSHSV